MFATSNKLFGSILNSTIKEVGALKDLKVNIHRNFQFLVMEHVTKELARARFFGTSTRFRHAVSGLRHKFPRSRPHDITLQLTGEAVGNSVTLGLCFHPLGEFHVSG